MTGLKISSIVHAAIMGSLHKISDSVSLTVVIWWIVFIPNHLLILCSRKAAEKSLDLTESSAAQPEERHSAWADVYVTVPLSLTNTHTHTCTDVSVAVERELGLFEVSTG